MICDAEKEEVDGGVAAGQWLELALGMDSSRAAQTIILSPACFQVSKAMCVWSVKELRTGPKYQ